MLLGVASAEPFGGRDGCLLMLELKSGKVLREINPRRCQQRFSPCSTFKVAAAAMAFDAGIMETDRRFGWDGTVDPRPECNQDQTPASWMEHSVIWVTQVLTRELGLASVKRYLKDFEYGNQDFSGGLTQAWLTSSLRISAREQAQFMRRLLLGQLPILPTAQRQTVGILVRQQSPRASLAGKTGSGRLPGGRQLGWYIGHLRTHRGQEAVVVINTTDRRSGQTSGPAGLNARSLLQTWLREQGLW